MSILRSIKTLFSSPIPESSPHPEPTPEPAPAPPAIPELSPAKLQRLQQENEPLILDCRESWERRLGYIPGSIHIPMNDIPQRLEELGREQEIVVVCAHGNRSQAVTGYLLQQGFQAANLTGGMAVWQAQGGEVARD